jgi:hypothetical protein
MIVSGGTTDTPAWVAIRVWFLFQVVAAFGLLKVSAAGRASR